MKRWAGIAATAAWVLVGCSGGNPQIAKAPFYIHQNSVLNGEVAPYHPRTPSPRIT